MSLKLKQNHPPRSLACGKVVLESFKTSDYLIW